VTHSGSTLQEAIANVYAACDRIHFDGLQMRRDIDAKASNAGRVKSRRGLPLPPSGAALDYAVLRKAVALPPGIRLTPGPMLKLVDRQLGATGLLHDNCE